MPKRPQRPSRPSPKQRPFVLKVPEAAARLGTTPERVYEQIEEGRLAAVNVGAKNRTCWRVLASSVRRAKDAKEGRRMR